MSMSDRRPVRIDGVSYVVRCDPATSERLANVRRARTKPEQQVSVVLEELGARYEQNAEQLPGSPDFADESRRWALFVHGCYWHHHRGCSRATIPTNNREFWIAKFADNRRRDRRKADALRRAGFRVTTVWECEVHQSRERVRRRIARLLAGRNGQQGDHRARKSKGT